MMTPPATMAHEYVPNLALSRADDGPRTRGLRSYDARRIKKSSPPDDDGQPCSDQHVDDQRGSVVRADAR
jgi:hypothetical protein